MTASRSRSTDGQATSRSPPSPAPSLATAAPPRDSTPTSRSAYAAAKNAQLGLTLSWARELAPFGITVNTVAPGFIPVERHAAVPDEDRAAYLATVPAGRMGTPSDIARAVSFFAAEDAGFVTGQRIVVDGGRSLGT